MNLACVLAVSEHDWLPPGKASQLRASSWFGLTLMPLLSHHQPHLLLLASEMLSNMVRTTLDSVNLTSHVSCFNV